MDILGRRTQLEVLLSVLLLAALLALLACLLVLGLGFSSGNNVKHLPPSMLLFPTPAYPSPPHPSFLSFTFFLLSFVPVPSPHCFFYPFLPPAFLSFRLSFVILSYPTYPSLHPHPISSLNLISCPATPFFLYFPSFPSLTFLPYPHILLSLLIFLPLFSLTFSPPPIICCPLLSMSTTSFPSHTPPFLSPPTFLFPSFPTPTHLSLPPPCFSYVFLLFFLPFYFLLISFSASYFLSFPIPHPFLFCLPVPFLLPPILLYISLFFSEFLLCVSNSSFPFLYFPSPPFLFYRLPSSRVPRRYPPYLLNRYSFIF